MISCFFIHCMYACLLFDGGEGIYVDWSLSGWLDFGTSFLKAEEARQSKQDRYSEMRRLKDEEREAQERKLEEEAKAQKAREEEAAALEFDKWKGEFSVDDEGTLEEEQDKTEDLLTNFVEYIKKHKCVPLEDLAAEFKLRTQECINRITSLESMGRLSGVMDDRGKFIYISQEEMKAVADYIKRQGRVSISHLASKSNQFIDLEPKTHYTEDISNMEEITVNWQGFLGLHVKKNHVMYIKKKNALIWLY